MVGKMKIVAKKIFDWIGLEISRKKLGKKYGKVPGYHRLDRLPSMKTVIDVGVGHNGSSFLYERGWDPYFICIDPLDESRQAVKSMLPKERVNFIQCAVGKEKKEQVLFNVSAVPSRTSLLQRNRHDEASTPNEVRITTIECLDDIVTDEDVQSPALLKIDIEGGELDCLKGAKRLLNRIDYLLIELPLTDNYNNSYRFSDVICFLKYFKFQPLLVLKAGNNNVDFLFCKESDPLRKELSYGCENQ